MVAKFFSLSLYNKKRKCMSWISLQLKYPWNQRWDISELDLLVNYPLKRTILCPALNVSIVSHLLLSSLVISFHFFFLLEQPHSYGLRSDNAINMHRHVARTRPQTWLKPSVGSFEKSTSLPFVAH